MTVADEEDLAEISPLLTAAGLDAWHPADGPAEALVARNERAELVGCAIVVSYGDVGLLRSVAVAHDQRGTGLGRSLVEALLARPAVRRLRTVYLLTTTAAGFFERLGFAAVDRAGVDPVIKRTRQYLEECPTTAVVMRIDLPTRGNVRQPRRRR